MSSTCIGRCSSSSTTATRHQRRRSPSNENFSNAESSSHGIDFLKQGGPKTKRHRRHRHRVTAVETLIASRVSKRRFSNRQQINQFANTVEDPRPVPGFIFVESAIYSKKTNRILVNQYYPMAYAITPSMFVMIISKDKRCPLRLLLLLTILLTGRLL